VTEDGNLLIRKMLNFDEGWYTCTPYNILGSTGESGEIHLIAKEPPVFTQRPQAEIETEIGKPLTLYCNGKGDPEPTLSWKKVSKLKISQLKVSQIKMLNRFKPFIRLRKERKMDQKFSFNLFST